MNMKDLGQMGESTFSLWCAEAGLIANPSEIDKTGWDFLVEFPFTSGTSPLEIHKSAYECKVQVKATDQRGRKIAVSISNLRRLITAQMPAFLVLIEFDRQSFAQRAFVVHIDNFLISNVLKRMHEIEQSKKNKDFNKRTMTIHYNDSHGLEKLNGECLRRRFFDHIGDDVAEYIVRKKTHLESTGFEEGYGEMTFSTEGEDAIKQLIDVSLGIDKIASISNVKYVNARFGICSNKALFHFDGGQLAMPNIKPFAHGKIRFKEDDLGLGMSFDAKIYISPFNSVISDNLKKFRVAGEFFEMSFNPYVGTASYSFSFAEEVRLEVRKFREAIKLLNVLALSEKKKFVEMIFDSLPDLQFKIWCKNQGIDYAQELKVLDCLIRVISIFEFYDPIDISYYEILRWERSILLVCSFFNSSPALFKVEFDADFNRSEMENEVACISMISAPIGKYVFLILFVMKGKAEEIREGRFFLIPQEVVTEKKFVFEKGEDFFNKEFYSIVDSVESKYSDQCTVISIIDSMQ